MKNKILFNFYLVIILIIASISYLFSNLSLINMCALYILAIIPFIVKRIKSDSVFDLGMLFILIYSLYVLSIPQRILFGDINTDPLFFLANDEFLVYKFIYICGICATIPFMIGYDLFYNKVYNKIKGKKIYIKTKIEIVFIILSIIGAILFVIGIYKSGGIKFLLSPYIWSSDNTIDKGIMIGGFYIFLCFTLIEFYCYLSNIKNDNKKFNIFKWKMLYITLPILLIKLMQGGRLPVIMLLLGILCIYSNVYKKISTTKFITFGIILIIVMGSAGFFRNYKALSIGDYNELKRYMFGGSANSEFYYDEYSSIAVLYLISNVGVEYLYGFTILDGIVYLIPRIIYNNKDSLMMTSSWITKYNNYVNISPLGGLNLAAQNLINGYIVFTIIFMFFIGIIFKRINEYKFNSNGLLFYCLFLSIFLFSFIRDPMSLSIKYLISYVIIPYIIFKVIYKKYCIKGEKVE